MSPARLPIPPLWLVKISCHRIWEYEFIGQYHSWTSPTEVFQANSQTNFLEFLSNRSPAFFQVLTRYSFLGAFCVADGIQNIPQNHLQSAAEKVLAKRRDSSHVTPSIPSTIDRSTATDVRMNQMCARSDVAPLFRNRPLRSPPFGVLPVESND